MAQGANVGDTIAGKYLIERVLGKGGMGVVVAARHLGLGERVAIKFLRPQALDQKEVVARFVREASTAARLRSEYVARIHDVGTLDGGEPYIVMEYLEGRDLGVLLSDSGRLSLEQSVNLMLQACEALAEAHSIGIIHRDLKPGNLIVVRRRDGTSAIKIIDFGISKLILPGGGGDLTMPSMMLGSPLYMAPEQMSSARDADPRSDVWSLGAILFHLVTGVPPFNAPSALEIFELITYGPPSLTALRPDVPEGVDRIVARCLQRARDKRFADVSELAEALVPFGPKTGHLLAESAARILRAADDTNSTTSPMSHAPVSSTDRPPPPAEPALLDVIRAERGDPTAVDGPRFPEPASSPAPFSLDLSYEGTTSRPKPRAPEEPSYEAPKPRTPTPSNEVAASGPNPPAQEEPAPLPLSPKAQDTAIEAAIQEALVSFGAAGKVMREGHFIVLQDEGPPTEIDAGSLPDQWLVLPADLRRRRVKDIARRLAEAQRTAKSSFGSGRGLGAGGPSLGLRIGVGIVVAGLAAATVRYWFAHDTPPPPPSGPAKETPEQERARLETSCRAVRGRIYSGASIGPYDTAGWVVELWLAGRSTGTPRFDPTAAALTSAVAGAKLTEKADEVIAQTTEGTASLGAGPALDTSPGWSGVTLTLGGGYARAFFDAEKRPRFLTMADRLADGAGAELGALYARCAHLPVHDVGAWYRGREAEGAAAALVYGAGMFAERPTVNRTLLARVDAHGELDALKSAAQAAKLDSAAVKALVWDEGGSLLAAPGTVTITFPIGGPVRAARASRVVAKKMGIAVD